MIGALAGAEAAAALGEITAGMSGMDLGTAWTNQGMSDPYNVGFGVNNWTSNEPAISGHTENSITSSSEPDPLDAYEEAAEDSPDQVSQITGGIVSGSTIGTLNYALLEAANGDVTAVMPVAVPMDVAIVAGAQVLGVSMDAAEMDVEVKQQFANSVLAGQGLIYDAASDLVKAWWDGVNILFPRAFLSSIKDTIDELGLGESGEVLPSFDRTQYSNPPSQNVLDALSFPLKYAELGPGDHIIGTVNGSYYWIRTTTALKAAISKYSSGAVQGYVHLFKSDRTSAYSAMYYGTSSDPNTLPRNFYTLSSSQYSNLTDVTGTRFWCASFGVTSDNEATNYVNGPWSTVSDWIAKMYFADGKVEYSGEYPEGTEASLATKYGVDDITSAGGLAVSASDTIDVVPVNIPENPTSTIGSTVDPISSTDDDTVSDLPAPPIPLPIPDTNVSNPDVPLTDASVINAALIDELVEELANTLDPQPAQSTGLIPFPLLPGLPDGQGGSSYPSIVPASGSGLIHVYNPTPAEFVSFGNWLWVTYADATIDKIWNNPFDGIIGAHELYATPSTSGSDNIRSGFLVCPTTAALVRQRYTEIDCGSIVVPEFYGNYLDYSPYSQAYVYLPFIGIQEVSIDDIVGHAVNIRYRVDAYNGSCIAMIYVAKSGYRNLCYQFAGNCAVEVPLAGGSQAAIKAGMMQAEAYATAGVQSSVLTGIGQALSGLASGLAHGGIAGALGGLASGALGGLANYGAAKINAGATRDAALVANKSSVQHSGTFGASHGAMGLKIPFIMIRNPIQVKVVNYNEDYGFPAHKRVIIGGCHGYLRVKEVNVISATATNEEKMAIEEALKAGVYVD